jgi:hypothetical protein
MERSTQFNRNTTEPAPQIISTGRSARGSVSRHPERLVLISTSARSPVATALYRTGKFLEAGLWPSDKTANNALMNSKQHTYRGLLSWCAAAGHALPLPQQIQGELCARVASLFASDPHCSPVGDKSHDAAQDHRQDVSHANIYQVAVHHSSPGGRSLDKGSFHRPAPAESITLVRKIAGMVCNFRCDPGPQTIPSTPDRLSSPEL